MNRHAPGKQTVLCVFLIGLFCLPGRTEEAADTLSLKTAIDLALHHDIRLLPGKTALELAQLREQAPTLPLDPEARFSSSWSEGQRDSGTSLRFFPRHPWVLQADKNLLTAQTETASAEFQTVQLLASVEVFRLYRELQCAEKEKQLFDRLTALRKESVRLKASQADSGTETSGRALLALWEQSETVQDARELARKISLQKNLLSAQTGIPAEQLTLPPLSLSKPFRPVAVDETVMRAQQNRPDLQLLEAQQRAAKSLAERAQAERIPWIKHVETGYSGDPDEWSVQVAVSLPIFSACGSQQRWAMAGLSLKELEIAESQKAAAAQIARTAMALNEAVDSWNLQQEESSGLLEATRREIEKLTAFPSIRPQDQSALEERLITAELKMLNRLRTVFSAQADFAAAAGSLDAIQD